MIFNKRFSFSPKSFWLRSQLGRYPLTFYPLYRMQATSRRLFVTRETELVLEGYPRSANTFAVVAFQRAQPREVRIAHHLHVAAQVVRAARWHIPTVVLVRKPEDAVLSLVIRNSGTTIARALETYVTFHKRVYPYRDSFVVAPFETVTHDLASVIRQVNERFGTTFVALTPTGDELEAVFTEIDGLEGHLERTPQRQALQVSRPSEARRALKEKLLAELHSAEHARLLAAATAVYQDLKA